ncbi:MULTISPECIES: SusC/RagA family TonB-linked outer membrane protein [Myroides]|uniref:SusC/RagA family TonB-linked outer membrane protein n=1 Tax=Myroides TaxID=76831 RepID=UPI00057E4253|nr:MULTISPECIES: SusC/RagA family TonB-linked outer membrane protein [Myroides]AJA67909.1 TonB-linked outer membrane protein, SusC/RagA family [Myroides sp. A21]MDM1497211.1 SusC/RagA family TonB-linked outer membrane protein [Myroides odoratimimus]
MKKSRLNWFYASLLLLSVSAGYAQDKKLTGVVSEGGMPLPGVSVTIQGTNHGTQTDLDGNYSLNVKPGDVLVFSFIGMQDTTYKVGNANTHNVNLSTDDNILDEVIVVGYGTATKESFSGSASQISSAQIEKKSVSNAVAALAGEAAGVRIINPTGQPGAEPTVRIRGFGSVNGNRSPLYIVDGVPYSGSISSINPADIGSMTVLKDATATAIYGSRGANGVIIINTKTGKGSKSFIEVEAKTGVNWRALPQYDKIESPETYIEYAYEGLKNYGKIKGNFSDSDATLWANQNLFKGDYGISANFNMWNVANGGELIDPTTGKVRNGVTRKYNPEKWEDYAFQSSRRIEGNLNMGGSSDKTSYYSSIGYLKDEGYSVKSDYERLTARLNLQHKPKEWLDAKMNIGYTHSQSNNSGQASDSGSVFWFTDNIPSIYPLFLRDAEGNFVKDVYGGNQYDYGTGRGFGALTNSIGDVHYGLNRTLRDEMNANASFIVKLYDGLTFETTIGGQYYNSTNNQRSDRYYGSAASMKGSIYKVKSEVFSYNWTKMLRYKKSFGNHGIEALAAHENYSWEYRYNTMNKSDLADPHSTELNNAGTPINSTGYISDYTLESYFGQVNYDYANKYYLTGSIRRDGSSRFKDDKWGTFASIGASWVASKEDFMLNQDLVSYLKLKASYGTTGDQAVGSYYPGNNLWQVDTYGGSLAIYETSIGNTSLTWEKSKMFQVGAEFSLKQFLDVNIDYYIKNTDDMIFTRAIGPSAGYASMTVNDGKLMNRGLEFNVTGHLLKTKDAYIDLSINGEYLKNELKRMPIDPSTGREKVLDVNGIYGRSKGYSLGDFYMREWAGVNSETGQAQWYTYSYVDGAGQKQYVSSLTDFLADNPDMEGKLTKETTTSYARGTLQHIGKSAIPKLRGGINLSAGYKGWDFSVQMLYSLGGYAYDSAYANLMGNGKIGGNNWHNDIANRWQKPGDITDVPRLSSNADTNVNSTSTRFLTKSDYLAINNMRLGYSLPKEYVKQLGLSDLSFFVSGDNLFLFTKRDGFNPAASEFGSSSMYQYPPLTTFTGGVKVKF